jgi:hypothetical protein
MFGIDENGTNFPTFVFDPDEYVQAYYYDEEQPEADEKKRKSNLPQIKIKP